MRAERRGEGIEFGLGALLRWEYFNKNWSTKGQGCVSL